MAQQKRAKSALCPQMKDLAATAAEYVWVVVITAREPANDNNGNNNPDPGINSVVVTVTAW